MCKKTIRNTLQYQQIGKNENLAYVCILPSLAIGPIALNLEIFHLKRCLTIEKKKSIIGNVTNILEK